MAFIQCDFYSQVLGSGTSMNVILPGDSKIDQSQTPKNYPVLYLLHGLSDDYTVWSRRSSIERYVRELDIAIVMPDAARSFYTDMHHGDDYYTFISEEVPKMAERFFPISPKREDCFIAGLSMGGYGALKIGLSRPDKFSAVASLSGAVDILSLADQFEHQESIDVPKELNAIFGPKDQFKNSAHDIFALASQCAQANPKPRVYTTCGTEDFLYKDNICFKNYMEDLSFDYTYEEGPGEHHWDYWDLKIQSVLNWLEIK